MPSCFFIGHRECTSEILPLALEAVERHIVEYGVTRFIVGGYGGFDSVAASAVTRAKKMHPEIEISQLIPYHPAERPTEPWPEFDTTYYPFEGRTPLRKFAIVKANEQMIHDCDYLIAYAWHPASNARTIVEKAQRLQKRGGIHVENLAENRIKHSSGDSSDSDR